MIDDVVQTWSSWCSSAKWLLSPPAPISVHRSIDVAASTTCCATGRCSRRRRISSSFDSRLSTCFSVLTLMMLEFV